MTNSVPGSFGFVGLGAMGMPIAARLASVLGGLVISDLAVDRIAATVSASDGKAYQDDDRLLRTNTVFLCLPTPDAVKDVLDALLDGPDQSRSIIDLGANHPDFVVEMGEKCAARSASYCDCPVFGAPSMAAQGDLYFLFSGPQKCEELFRQVADLAGYRVAYAGGSGTASTVKLLQNALGVANLAVGAEVLRVCEAAKIDPVMFIDVVRECGGIGRSSVFDRFAEDMAARRDSGEGRLRIAAKDMSSMIDVASGCAVETPLLKQTESLFRQAIAAGLADCQFTDIIRIANAAEPGKHD